MIKVAEQLESRIDAELQRVIEVFDSELASDLPAVSRLVEHVRHYRGKLLRPRLVLLTAHAVGDIRREHITIAAVIEMIHMATLVHDDVLDEADVRRRTATVSRLAGNEAAVMLGDYLISHAYHLCSSIGSARTARRIAAVTNTVCEGELMQIHHRGNFDLTEQQYFDIIRRKTAALTGICCELAATACEASDEIVAQMSAFGTELGIAFQIIDDLLDLTGSTQELGKSAGRDAELDKLTLPAIHYLRHASPAQRDQLINALHSSEREATKLASILEDSGSVRYALDQAAQYVNSAIDRLSDLPDSDAKETLISAARFVIDRRN